VISCFVDGQACHKTYALLPLRPPVNSLDTHIGVDNSYKHYGDVIINYLNDESRNS
jgi:hypothetical protein